MRSRCSAWPARRRPRTGERSRSGARALHDGAGDVPRRRSPRRRRRRMGRPAPCPARGGPPRSRRGPARGAGSISVAPARSSPSSKPSSVSHPLRERLWVSLITALYRSGRQADALGAYTRVREALAEQLGLEPGPALRALEQQVLLQDPALDGVRLAGRTAFASSSQPPSGAHLADDGPRRRPGCREPTRGR